MARPFSYPAEAVIEYRQEPRQAVIRKGQFSVTDPVLYDTDSNGNLIRVFTGNVGLEVREFHELPQVR